jgi:hypothetical protein
MLILAALAVVGASSCSIFDLFGGVSIAARISYFEGELNSSDRGLTYQQFHPTLTTAYDAIKAPAFWDTPFPVVEAGDDSYVVTTTGNPAADPADVRATIDGPLSFGGPKVTKLVMAKDGANWMIQALYFRNADGVTWDVVVN